MGTSVGTSTPWYQRGDVVIVSFPLSLPTSATGPVKRRPAVVLAVWRIGNSFDCLTALITSKPAPDPLIMPLASSDITGGALTVPASFLRPAYLFAADESVIAYRIGTLRTDLVDEAARRAADLLIKGRV